METEIHDEDLAPANRLYRLDELDDFEVSSDDPDIRGWDVYTEDGTKIGEIEELIVNPAQFKVRYIEVEVDSDVNWTPDDDTRLLIPIANATLQDEENKVVIQGLNAASLPGLPLFHGDLTAEYERTLLQSYSSTGLSASPANGEEKKFMKHK
ncbi:MAG: PRC-barrel domain-containing protein [Bacteroidota bacterium]|nr:PRC-barrel domain-containing protein [Bacteroidota bacterium]